MSIQELADRFQAQRGEMDEFERAAFQDLVERAKGFEAFFNKEVQKIVDRSMEQMCHIKFSKSNAVCIKCERDVKVDEASDRLHKAKRFYIKHKCAGCGHVFAVTSNYMGDLVSFELSELKEKPPSDFPLKRHKPGQMNSRTHP